MAPTELQAVSTTAVPVADDTGVMTITGNSVSGWSAEFLGGQAAVGYLLKDATGAVVAHGVVDVDWVRVGGTERCGGPREAQIEIAP